MDYNNSQENGAANSQDSGNLYYDAGQTDTRVNNAGYTDGWANNAGYVSSAYGAGNMPVIQPVNKGLGVLGAAIGAILGGAVWWLLGILGYVSAWVGVLIFVLAINLYKKFSKTPKEADAGTFGTVTCAVLGVLIIVPADWLCYTYQVWRILNEGGRSSSFLEVLENMPFYMYNGELWGSFISDLVLGLLFTGVGALIIVVGAAKSRRDKNKI